MKKLLILAFAIFAIANHRLGLSDLRAEIAKVREIEDAIAKVAEKSFPAVVVITTKKKVQIRTPFSPWEFFFDFDHPQWERFKRKFKMPEQPQIQGGGSGFIVSEDGYIVTNNHVVSGMDEIIVRLQDKTEFNAEIVGTDPKTDIAVLKIKADRKLPVLEFADSDKVRIGQFCIAIGAPFMFDYTVTFGIVSQKGRQVGMKFYENYIQTDAAINMGNSGGPLLDIEGKVIGINNFIVSGSALSPGNIGLGFAIPSNMAKSVYNQIVKHGKVIRPWVGIGMDELTPDMKKKLSIQNGVIVREVYEGNPADKAGIEPGDIIIKVAGKEVNSPRDVQMRVLDFKPGDKIEFEIIRNGKNLKVNVVTAEQADDIAATIRGHTATESLFGMKFEEKDGKIYVSEVEEDSIADNFGIEPGHALISINGKQVKNLDELKKIISSDPKEISIVLSDGRSKKIFKMQK